MPVFASVDELRARWRNCPEDITDAVLGTLLEDASLWLSTTFPAVPRDPGERLAASLRLVACAMVKRSLISEDADGAEQVTDTQGPFSSSRKFTNAEGNFFLTRQERELIEAALENRDAATFRVVSASGW